MNKKTIFICINGIRNWPGSENNWTGKFVTYVQSTTPHKAEKVEYFCTAIGRAFGQKDRTKKLYKTLSFYKDYNIILVTHSNGSAVLLEMLKNFDDWPNLQEIHLVCGACQADFEKSGLNQFIKEGRIKKCFIYIAGKDGMLKLAKTWLGRLLGYKSLGLVGPHNVSNSIKNKVVEIWEGKWKNYGHSDCWNDENFEDTMRYFI